MSKAKKDFENFYEHPKIQQFIKKAYNPHFEDTQIDLNSRVLICGSSGSGKTNALLQFISKTSGTFAKIIIVYKESEPLYELLREGIKRNLDFYTDLGKLPSIEKMRDKMGDEEEILLVIDDWINECSKYPNVCDIFIRGRKKGITTFFLAQSYFKIPKLLRQQMTYLILLRMSSNKDINLILSDFQTKDPDELRRIYKDATKEKLNFLKVNVNSSNMATKFSKNFTDFYEIKED